MRPAVFVLAVAGLFALAQSARAQTTQAYKYDAFGRLIGASSATGAQATNTGYTYDYADNRVLLQRSQGSASGGPPSPDQAGPGSAHARFSDQQRQILTACLPNGSNVQSAACHP